MRWLLVATIGVGVLVFLYLYFEAKARAYRGKMEAFSVSNEDEVSGPAQDPARSVAEPTIGPGESPVDDDRVDPDGESVGLRKRRLV
jgi:hypothetical protein